MKIVLLLLAPLLLLSALLPDDRVVSSGAVTDMLINNNRLYVATDAGCVDLFSVQKHKKVNSICVEPLVDFMGDEVASKIFSVDVMDGKLLILSQEKMGYRRVDIYKDKNFFPIITLQDELAISKAKFVDKKHILLALLSNEIILFDLEKREEIWRIQSSSSKFSDFSLNEERSEVVVADESGDLKVYKLETAKLLKVLSGKNLDNVFQVDYKNGVIATAGQDRRCVIYQKNGSSEILKSTFLIYGVGLSPSADKVAFQSSEENDVTLFNLKTQRKEEVLGSNKMNISKIIFLNESEIFISSDSSVINYYKIDKVR